MDRAYIDALTSLCNRAGLQNYYMELSEQETVSLLFVDLDNFKIVNDIYGHAEGDYLLCAVAEILKNIISEGICCRLGGDEFVVVVKGEQSRDSIAAIAEAFFEQLRMKKKDSNGFSIISASIGIVHNTMNKEDVNALIKKADIALYSAKSSGKACYVFYNDLEERIEKENFIERMAVEAVNKNQFLIKFHPIIHMQSSKIVRVDTYALWHLEDGRVIEAKDYRPVFEKTGFIKKFDTYIFDRICCEIAKMKQSITNVPYVSIMFSRISLLDPELAQNLLSILDKYGISVNDIEISVNETIFGIRGSERILEALNTLHENGFCIALTNFGKDFSSMKHLKSLPIQSLRLSSVFLNRNYGDGKGRHTIMSFVKLGKEYNLLVIGYGVDDSDKRKFLNGCGCDAISMAYDENQFGLDEFIAYFQKLGGRVEQVAEFDFKDSLTSKDGQFTGKIRGEGITFGKGINQEWGGIYFPGGEVDTNVVEFPVELFSNTSYTISLWIRPDHPQILTSVIYMRYLGGFASLMPYRRNIVTSTYRIHEDENVSVWHDASCRAVEAGTWNHIVVSYDAFSETMRYYLNGRKSATEVDAPILVACKEVLLGGDPFQVSYEGAVSALMIYDSVKSDDEIEQLYKSFCDVPEFCGMAEKFWMEE